MQEPIPAEEFKPILEELQKRPLRVNKYRTESGLGKSQAFGIVNRRSSPPDYARWCWQRTYLYKLLLDFAEKWVKIPYTSITVNDNYQATKHKDRGNTGNSLLVAFGDYEGGELEIHEGDLKGSYNIKHTPIITDFSKVFHSVKDFTGSRYSLVFYTLDPKGRGDITNIPKPSVVNINGKWFFKRGDELIKNGLPHPLKGVPKATFKKVDEPIVISFK